MSPRTILLVGAPSFSSVQRTFPEDGEASQCRADRIPQSVANHGSVANVRGVSVRSRTTAKRNEQVGCTQTSTALESFDIEETTAALSADAGPEWRLIALTSELVNTELICNDWLAWTPLEWVQRTVHWNPTDGGPPQKQNSFAKSPSTEFDGESCDGEDDASGCEEVFLERSFALHEGVNQPMTPVASFARGHDEFETPLTPITESSDAESLAVPSSPLASKSAKKGQAMSFSALSQRQAFSIPTDFPTALVDIPSANDVLRAKPSTLTANLIVGLLALKPTRSVYIKKNNRNAELQELVVGDNTSPNGFGISFWLEAPAHAGYGDRPVPNSPKHDLDRELRGLHVGDAILITNVALGQWKGQVHGSSLARRGWRTEARLLWRKRQGWSPLGKELLKKSRTQKSNDSWASRVCTVQSWAENTIAPGLSMELPSCESGSPSSQRKKRKFLPDDDTFEF